ncbi:hypothetical protein PVK06_039764 [Gossypium arboreum]|uniref:Uncharacterized protein n=1 Tax=Gossypium arboreum TaxID=29729 RepID=A0ABR0N4D9_GOSAR|nr:hypothetical protein PVK06_039764 [Gossypium arboreum]
MSEHSLESNGKISTLIKVVTSRDNIISTLDDTLVNVATSFIEPTSSESPIDTFMFTTNIVKPREIFIKGTDNIFQIIEAPTSPIIMEKKAKFDASNAKAEVTGEFPTSTGPSLVRRRRMRSIMSKELIDIAIAKKKEKGRLL